jgi:hypothetical protein
VQDDRRVKRGAALLIGVSLAIYLLAKLNWEYPVLRFESPMANHVVLGVLLFSPIVALIVGWRVTRASKRALVSIALIPLSLAGVLEGSLIIYNAVTSADLSKGSDPGLRAEAVEEIGPVRVVAYRTNCAASCSFGATLRVERRIAPGLRLVRSAGTWFPADSVALRRDDGNVVASIAIRDTTPKPPREVVVRVRPWVYF